MTKHTPGPWRLACDAQGPCMVMHPTESGVAIANLGSVYVPANGYFDGAVEIPEPCPEVSDNKTYRPERVANARLIAAAPELFEACKKALTCGLDSSVRQLVVTAIAKAEGK